MLAFRPNILIATPSGYPIAIVEVGNRQNLTAEVAIELRSNLIAHGLLPQIPYFLLVSQDTGFLWRGTSESSPDAPPAYEFPMDKVVARYFRGAVNRRLLNMSLELIVYQWLLDIAEGVQEPTEEPERALAAAGFIQAIRGAVVSAEALQ